MIALIKDFFPAAPEIEAVFGVIVRCGDWMTAFVDGCWCWPFLSACDPNKTVLQHS